MESVPYNDWFVRHREESTLRLIHDGEIRFVGEEVLFHGAAFRLVKRIAREHKVSMRQVAEGLVSGMQQGIDVTADLMRALDKLRRLLNKDRGK
jgi:hypothetical protein